MPTRFVKSTVVTVALLVSLFSTGCAPGRDFEAHLNLIVQPYRFSIARWESRAIPHEVDQWLFARRRKIDDEIRVVTEYFSSAERIRTLESQIEAVPAGSGESDAALLEAELSRLRRQRTTLETSVPSIMKKQIRHTLTRQGIFNPLDNYIGLEVGFPPLSFKLESPPRLLVISPRERIESIREITLEPRLTPGEMEDIEARVDELGVSSLVVKLSGLAATYPTFVTNEANLRSTIDTAVEEWLHQYLVFKPLGFLYLLDLSGLSRNYEIATMNESLAGMVSQEIGAIVYQEYYSEYENGVSPNQTAEPAFDFPREMREIRKTVDGYLARGEIERAEEFMEQKRQYLASKGHDIRKLNQAYFAFHGTYADSPAFVSPVGLELKQLRSQSASLREFLGTVAVMTSRQELRDSIR